MSADIGVKQTGLGDLRQDKIANNENKGGGTRGGIQGSFNLTGGRKV